MFIHYLLISNKNSNVEITESVALKLKTTQKKAGKPHDMQMLGTKNAWQCYKDNGLVNKNVY